MMQSPKSISSSKSKGNCSKVISSKNPSPVAKIEVIS